MRRIHVCVLLGLLLVAVSSQLQADATTQTQPPASGKDTRSATGPTADEGTVPPKAPVTPSFLSILIGTVVLLALVVVLVLAGRSPEDSYIRRLGPSFFFWLGMLYLCTLLVIAVAYISNCYGIQQFLDDPVAGVMPVAVPWFGALGAVVISLQGVYDFNDRWDPKYNYWHMGRPLFGAVVGIVAFFLLTVTVTASGAPQTGAGPTQTGRVFYYVVAFLVGYREETFRELLKRAVDLILQPGGNASTSPAVTFKVGGVSPLRIDCGQAAANTAKREVVEVHNTGNAPLVSPSVAVAPVGPVPPATFQRENDHVTGGADLAAGAFRTVDVVFTPSAPGSFSGTLTVTATNLNTPKTIPLSGSGT